MWGICFTRHQPGQRQAAHSNLLSQSSKVLFASAPHASPPEDGLPFKTQVCGVLLRIRALLYSPGVDPEIYTHYYYYFLLDPLTLQDLPPTNPLTRKSCTSVTKADPGAKQEEKKKENHNIVPQSGPQFLWSKRTPLAGFHDLLGHYPTYASEVRL